MILVVCPAPALGAVCAERRPSHVLTFASPGRIAPDPPRGGRHLALAFNDIAGPRPNLVPPDRAAVERIVAFGRSWGGAEPLLASCEAGVSRSTAAAFAIACDRSPATPEDTIAWLLRAASPFATPNPLMVALADAILGREGRMAAAIAAIGRGAEYRPFASFDLAFAALPSA